MLKMMWQVCSTCRWTGFLGEKESAEQVTHVLVIRERRHKK